MPQLILKGKKKSDLAVIAQVAGLLTEQETKDDKKELLDYLLSVEEKLTADKTAPESKLEQGPEATVKTAVESEKTPTSSRRHKPLPSRQLQTDTARDPAEAAIEETSETATSTTKRPRVVRRLGEPQPAKQ